MFKLKNRIKMGKVSLNVNDIEKMTEYYNKVIGLDILEKKDKKALLGKGKIELVELVKTKKTDKEVAGLYHLAILLPTRKDLGEALIHYYNNGGNLVGLSDHGYSEAIYLEDPEGNGIEVYRDKDISQWDIKDDGTIVGITKYMDVEGVISEAEKKQYKGVPEGTIMGHIHLHVRNLEDSKEFYSKLLGLDVKYDMGQALFIAQGLYHHDIAINTWKRNLRKRENEDLGLNYFEIKILDVEDYKNLIQNLEKENAEIKFLDEKSFEIEDKDGITARILLEV